jgi:hypothetical protein
MRQQVLRQEQLMLPLLYLRLFHLVLLIRLLA